MKEITFTRLNEHCDFIRVGIRNSFAGRLCSDVLGKLVKIPRSTRVITIVALKEKAPDTIHITDKVHETCWYLSVDGRFTELYYDTARTLRKEFLSKGYNYFRVELGA